jgi:hypothetical protein
MVDWNLKITGDKQPFSHCPLDQNPSGIRRKLPIQHPISNYLAQN